MVILKFLLKVKDEEAVFGYMWLRIGPEGALMNAVINSRVGVEFL
jgi:hypothetical protein